MGILNADHPAWPGQSYAESEKPMVGEYLNHYPGLTIREELAARFMTPLLSNPSLSARSFTGEIAETAVDAADQLIKKLGEKQNNRLP